MDNILRRIRNLSRISVEELNAYDLASNLLTRNDVHSQSQNNDSLNPRLNRHRSYVEGKTGGETGTGPIVFGTGFASRKLVRHWSG